MITGIFPLPVSRLPLLVLGLLLVLSSRTHAFLFGPRRDYATKRSSSIHPTTKAVVQESATHARRRRSATNRTDRTLSRLYCQLLGMNCAEPTEFNLAWPGFCARGGGTDIHADGWGMAYYHNESLREFHDVQAANTSPLAQFLGQQKIQTNNMLAHIRYATTGAVNLANVHPFSREMWGIHFSIVHNGEIPLFKDHPDTTLTPGERIYHPVGTTDSEAFFCAVLNALRAEFTDTMPSLPVLYDSLQQLSQKVVDYNPSETILNFLMTCGRHVLWVYSWPGARPGSTVWNGLHYTHHQYRGSERLLQPGMELNVGESSTTGEVAIIATKPLTENDEWIEIQQGELILFDEGKAYISARDLFHVELKGHGLEGRALRPPKLQEDMRLYQFEYDFFAGGSI